MPVLPAACLLDPYRSEGHLRLFAEVAEGRHHVLAGIGHPSGLRYGRDERPLKRNGYQHYAEHYAEYVVFQFHARRQYIDCENY